MIARNSPVRPNSRVAVVLTTLCVLLIVPLAGPVSMIGVARACGCGAYSPVDGGTARVPQETALVRASGDGVVDTYLSLTVDSDVRRGALLFPVPDVHATVTAGPRDLFDDLDRITAPRPSARSGDGNGAPAATPGGVTVQRRQSIGPLDVVTLTSDDGTALTSWLQQNGFAAKPALASAAAPYLEHGWAFIAVRLRPGAAGSTPLDGRLDPLHVRTHTSARRGFGYPMRLSALASAPEQVVVFTLTRGPVALASRTPGMARTYSAPLDRAARDTLARVATDTTWLSRWNGTLAPSTIVDDFHFSPGSDVTASAVRPFADAHDDAAVGWSVLGTVALLAVLGTAVVLHGRRTAPSQRP